jgi:hypothetical protein
VPVQTHREAVEAFLAERHLRTRSQADRLYIVGVKPWKGAAAYVEFDAPEATDWKSGGLWAGCRLKVVPLAGQRNWDYCRRVEAEIAGMITGGAELVP